MLCCLRGVVLLGFEPEEESPIVFLRLNKQVRKRALKVTAIATKLSIGVEKLKGEFVKVAPGQESAAIAAQSLTAKSVILVGERAAESAGMFREIFGYGADARRSARQTSGGAGETRPR